MTYAEIFYTIDGQQLEPLRLEFKDAPIVYHQAPGDDYTLYICYYDADGNKVTGTEQKVTAKANKNVQPYSTKCQIDNVHLWNGTKDPYLYTANVTIYNENDEVLDTVSDNFGVRTYEIKNGKFY